MDNDFDEGVSEQATPGVTFTDHERLYHDAIVVLPSLRTVHNNAIEDIGVVRHELLQNDVRLNAAEREAMGAKSDLRCLKREAERILEAHGLKAVPADPYGGIWATLSQLDTELQKAQLKLRQTQHRAVGVAEDANSMQNASRRDTRRDSGRYHSLALRPQDQANLGIGRADGEVNDESGANEEGDRNREDDENGPSDEQGGDVVMGEDDADGLYERSTNQKRLGSPMKGGSVDNHDPKHIWSGFGI